MHFNINPDTDTGRVLGGPCSAPTGDLQTFTGMYYIYYCAAQVLFRIVMLTDYR